MAYHSPMNEAGAQSGSVDTDVIVAGAGAAGLAAAISAADGGVTVALLEAAETFRTGSNTSMSTSMIPVGGSRWQDAAGIDDSKERLYDDIIAKTHGSADPVVAMALIEVGEELADFLAEDCSMPLELVLDAQYPGHSRKRHLCVPDRAGRTMHRHLLEAAERREAITMVVPSRVVGLEPVGDGPEPIWKVTTRTPDGEEQIITTSAVILATNGFGANPERVAAHIPEIGEGLYFGGDHSLGDALDIGESLGADTAYLDSYQGHGSVATPHGVLLTWTTVMNGAFLVSQNGTRFGDESTGYSEYAVQVLAQPDAIAWVVYDQRINDDALPFDDYQQLIESGGIRWADDVATLADGIGCDPAALEASFAEVARASTGQGEDPFGRTSWGPPLTGPFAAVKVTGALFHTQGGLTVDGSARVLRNGEPIPGLYAAGGAAAGISGHGADGYMSGNGLLCALGLGYIAGRHITAGNPAR